MIGALIILVALVGVGLVLYLFHRRDVRRGEAQAPTRGPMTDVPPGEDGEVCCGMHATFSAGRSQRKDRVFRR